MSQTEKRTRRANIQALKHQLHVFEEALELSGEWTTAKLSYGRSASSDAVSILKHAGAIRIVGRESFPNSGTHVNVYRWDEDIKNELKDYKNALNRFCDYIEDGCHCRTHIPETVDPFVCKHCGQEYSRAEIEQIEL